MALSKQQQIIFDRYMEMEGRPSGSAIATEYKRGLDGHRSIAPHTSLAFAAYQAGVSKRNIAAYSNSNGEQVTYDRRGKPHKAER